VPTGALLLIWLGVGDVLPRRLVMRRPNGRPTEIHHLPYWLRPMRNPRKPQDAPNSCGGLLMQESP
jgi:hypothetical protein